MKPSKLFLTEQSGCYAYVTIQSIAREESQFGRFGNEMTESTKFLNETRTMLQSQASKIRSLETQINQLAIASSSPSHRTLSSNTEVNPKDHCNTVTLRSGKELASENIDSEKVKVDENTEN